jgi:hypothetical protein
VVASAGVLSFYKARVVGFSRPLELFLVCTVDALAWAWLLCVSELGVRRFGGALGRAFAVAFFPLFYLTFACDVVHASFYEVAAERRFSLFDVDFAAAAFFLREVATTRWLLTAGAVVLAVHGAAWWLASLELHWSARNSIVGLCAGTAITLGAGLYASRIPSPLWDTASDAYDLVTLEKVAPKAGAASTETFAALDKSDVHDVHAPTFSKILVFVMETVPTVDFESERAQLRKGSFLASVDGHAHRYDRYYATNQDSRTGMLDMLGSRLVPYEAYTEHGLAHYAFLSKKSSLVQTFNRLDYATVYAVSHSDQEAVIREMPWRQMLTLPEERIRASSKKYRCLTIYEFEHGCEDLAILDDVLRIVDSNERLFLFQEFIWGHDPEYNQMSGRTNTDYYSAYIDRVVDHLRTRGKLDDTLIVVTSDHGFRSRKRLDRVESYELPLVFFSTRFEAARNAELRSHLDFKDILFYETGSRERPQSVNPFVMNIGPTGAGTLAVITADRGLLLLRMRENLTFVLADKRQQALPGADALLGIFREYRQRFDMFGQGGPTPAAHASGDVALRE